MSAFTVFQHLFVSDRGYTKAFVLILDKKGVEIHRKTFSYDAHPLYDCAKETMSKVKNALVRTFDDVKEIRFHCNVLGRIVYKRQEDGSLRAVSHDLPRQIKSAYTYQFINWNDKHTEENENLYEENKDLYVENEEVMECQGV